VSVQLSKRYYNHKGLDLKSSDLIRPIEYASSMLNAQYTDGGAIEKRPGFQGHAASCGGYGSWTYRRVDPVTGTQEPEVVTIDQNLYTLLTTTLTVAYSGSDATCVISIFLDISGPSNVYRCQILEGTTIILNSDLGIGFDEASPKTITTLASEINALTGFTATVTGTGSTPAAFLKIIREHDLNASDMENDAKYWSQINTPTSNPLSTYYANRNNEDHENVSSVQINNVIYFASGFNELMKYDGQNFYRAGLPNTSVSVATAAGAITGSNYIHRVQYIQHDSAGNIIEGNLAQTTATNAVANSFNLTINTIQASTGFNTNCAVVNGAQVSVNTITVDNGSGGSHTLKVGDTAYFFDTVSAAYVTREVTATAATTITVAGAAVTVSDNIVISNNLRIAIWRSKTSSVTPTSFNFVDEVPNNSFVSSIVYNDNKIDSALGELLFVPATDRSTPPKGRYVSQWNGIMLIGGIPDDKTGLAFSDVDGPEYFPNNSNRLLIEPGNGDVIAGIAPNNEVFAVFGDRSFTVISGEITTGQIRVETRARDIGCASHATIQDIDGVLYWLSSQGPRQSSGGQVPTPLGPALDPSEANEASRIDPAFNNDGKPSSEKFRLKRAVGYSDTPRDKYMVFVPTETFDGGDRYPNSSSRIFVYDKIRDAWLKWDKINFAGGMCQIDDELYFVERRFSSFTTSVQSIMYRRMNLIDSYDYADNTVGISLDYSPQWDALGEPSVLKNAISIRIFSLESVENNEFTVTIEEEINYQSDSSISTFDVDFSGGGYGNSAYGEDPYSDPSVDGILHPLGRSRIRSIRPRFKNEIIHENLSITGWELEFSTPYRPEFKP